MKNFFQKLMYWLRPKCKCGHKSKKSGTVTAYGETREVKLRRHWLFHRVPFCLECYEKKAIKCPWCGGAIFPGEYVTLYSPQDPNFKVPEGCVVYSKDPFRLVGCQSIRCAESGADYSGIWVGDHVERFESALEQCARTGNPVIRKF